MGAQVIVTEVNELRALEAVMDGYRIMPLREAARASDFVVTATGSKKVVGAADLEVMKDRCVLANAGHFDVEIDIVALDSLTVSRSRPRENVETRALGDGRRLHLLAQGRLVNLGAAEGHPPAVMDMSFANQLLCAEYLVRTRDRLENRVHEVPLEIDREVSRLKLATLGVAIDTLTPEQVAYLSSWREGT